MTKWLYPVAALGAAGAYWIAGDKACEAKLTVINASSEPLAALQVRAVGTDGDQEPATLASGAAFEILFAGFAEGSYTIRFKDADGRPIEDTQGYLIPGNAFNDTLTILPAAEKKRFALRQSPTSCRTPFHWRSFIRRLIRNLW